MEMIKVEHPYWGTCLARYINAGNEVEVEITLGCIQRYKAHTLVEDEVIQFLDIVEAEHRQNRFEQLLQSTLSEYKNKVYQNDAKDCETLLAKAQLAHKIIELLDLDIK